MAVLMGRPSEQWLAIIYLAQPVANFAAIRGVRLRVFAKRLPAEFIRVPRHLVGFKLRENYGIKINKESYFSFSFLMPIVTNRKIR